MTRNLRYVDGLFFTSIIGANCGHDLRVRGIFTVISIIVLIVMITLYD